MEVREFLGSLDSVDPSPVYLLCPCREKTKSSYEPELARRAIERLTAKYVDPSVKDLCFTAYDADEADLSEIASTAETLPFLSPRRVIVVRDADVFQTESAGKPLVRYLENPCPTTILILVAPGIDRRSKLARICEKAGTIVECPELTKEEACEWVVSEVSSRGKSIAPPAAKRLVERSGIRLSDLSNAATLVCTYTGDVKEIGEEDVLAACADVAEEEVWELTKAIADGDGNRALRACRKLLDLGKSEFEILGSINWMLKTAYAVASKTGSIPPWQAKRVGSLARRFGTDTLRRAFVECLKVDVQFRSTGVDRTLALELLVVKFATARQQRTARPRK